MLLYIHYFVHYFVHCSSKTIQSLDKGGSNLSSLIGCPPLPQNPLDSVRIVLSSSAHRNNIPLVLSTPLLFSSLEMASKLFPAAPRVGRQLFQGLPKSQCRAFSAGPQRCSDALAVVRIETPAQFIAILPWMSCVLMEYLEEFRENW